MSTGLKANSDGSAAIQVGGSDVITLTSGGAATFLTSPTTVQAGTAAAPSITFSGDTNTGIFSPAADTIAFTEGGVESMRIDSAGNAGLGVTPSAWTLGKVLEIGTATGNAIWGVGTSNMNIVSNVYYDGAYKFAGTGSAGTLAMSGGGFAFASSTASGTAGGTISFTDILGASRGNTLYLQGATSQSGTGITFPATQNASTNANTLDDYEEGTWTPAFGGGGGNGTLTYANQEGRYTKVGNMVTCWAFIVASSTVTGGAGTLQIRGLPFTAKNDANLQWFGSSTIGYFSSLDAYGTATNNLLLLGPQQNDSIVRFHCMTNAGDSGSHPTQAQVKNGTSFFVGFSYQV